jgi:hypothetical protein
VIIIVIDVEQDPQRRPHLSHQFGGPGFVQPQPPARGRDPQNEPHGDDRPNPIRIAPIDHVSTPFGTPLNRCGLPDRKQELADFRGIGRYPSGKPRSPFPETYGNAGKLAVRASYPAYFQRSSRPPGNGRINFERDWLISAVAGGCGSLGGDPRTSRVVRAGAGARMHSPSKSLPYSLDQTKCLRRHNSILPDILPNQGKREDDLFETRVEQ